MTWIKEGRTRNDRCSAWETREVIRNKHRVPVQVRCTESRLREHEHTYRGIPFRSR